MKHLVKIKIVFNNNKNLKNDPLSFVDCDKVNTWEPSHSKETFLSSTSENTDIETVC